MSTLSVRRPLALLAVLGMVATLLFAVAGTASAAAAMPEHEALFSACPDNADIPDGGFTDVPPGSFFNDSVNCLKYYEVTTGTTPTTYEPGAEVTRAQMAVFLYRLAPSAGVVLDSTPPDAGFTDIGELSVEAQTAINALADAGIVKGKTATTYAPADTVWRQQMALFLTRFLDEAIVGPGGYALGDATTDMAPFTDIGSTTFEANVAINQAWDLGIATGTTATTFDPVGNVNRGQMALFLQRLMGHANTRPAGVNIQANPTEGNVITPQADETMDTFIAITTRNADFTPATNTIVDFWGFKIATGLTATTPFLADGTCNPALFGGQIGGDVNPCQMDLGDLVTDPVGNAFFTYGLFTGISLDLYAWTGPLGEKFDVDTTAYSMVTLTPTRAADGYTFKVDVDPGEYAMMGDTVTWTIQVTDEGTPIAEAGWTFEMGYWKTVYQWNDATLTWDVLDDGGAWPITITTDATGKAIWTQTIVDPSATGDNWAQYSLWVNDRPPVVPTGPYAGTVAPYPVEWVDEAPYANSITVATPTEYKVEADGASNTVTATVLDQYGNPLANAPVDFSSLDDNADAEGLFGPPFTRYTNALGVASIQYTWDHTGAGPNFTALETITADAGSGVLDAIDFYWVDAGVDGDYGALQDVLVADVANKSAVRQNGSGVYMVFTWDANDQFNVDGVPSTMAAFEAAIGGTSADQFRVKPYFVADARVRKWNVTLIP